MNWAQLRGMVWLRWRLTRNQWRRGGQLNAAITLVAVVLALGAAVIGGFAGVAAGALGLPKALPSVNLLVWDGLAAAFLFFWTMGLIMELQRSEILDLSRLLILPISLRDVFLLNYLSSHFSISLALVLPAMLGLTIGLVFGSGVANVLLFPLVFGFFFMITAWTYCLRGWLASLMVNKRRRRAIIMGITFALVLLAQLPNLMTNVFMRNRHIDPRPQPRAVVQEPSIRHAVQPAKDIEQQLQEAQQRLQETQQQQLQEMEQQRALEAERRARGFDALDQVHRYVPLLWLPYGAKSLAEGRVWPAIFGAFGMFAIGAWGLTHAYHSTLRFYLGGKTKKVAPAPTAVPTIRTGKRILVERKVPLVPEEAGAMAVASLRSMLRAPEVKMALATNVLIFMFLGATMFLSRKADVPDAVKPLVAGGAAAVAIMGLAQLMFNHFGFDRSGFRAIVLLPTPRRNILLGKNLALLPVGLTAFAIYLGLAIFLAHLGAWDVLASVIEFIAALLVMSVIGNLASIYVPYRIAAGSLRPTKTDFTTSLLIFVTHMFFPLAALPIFLPVGLGLLCGHFELLPAAAVTLVCAVLLAGLAALLYWRTLEPIGRLLQRREKRILEVVTREVE